MADVADTPEVEEAFFFLEAYVRERLRSSYVSGVQKQQTSQGFTSEHLVHAMQDWWLS